MKTYIIYHKADLDGLVWARACAQHIQGVPEFIPMQYWDVFEEVLSTHTSITKIEELKDNTVMMVDFSLPTEQMERLNNNTEFYRFDHHISAIKDNEHLYIKGVRDIKKAGCRLAFNYHPGLAGNTPEALFSKRVIEAINLISLYDTWTKNDPVWSWQNDVLPYQYGFRLKAWLDREKVFEVMEDISKYPATNLNITVEWKLIIKYNKQQWESWMKKSGEVQLMYKQPSVDPTISHTIIEVTWLAVFWPAGGSSQVFESKRDPSIYDVMVYITYNINKKEYSISLYSDKDNIDCSVIAKYFGGGGHKWASWFVCQTLPFII